MTLKLFLTNPWQSPDPLSTVGEERLKGVPNRLVLCIPFNIDIRLGRKNHVVVPWTKSKLVKVIVIPTWISLIPN